MLCQQLFYVILNLLTGEDIMTCTPGIWKDLPTASELNSKRIYVGMTIKSVSEHPDITKYGMSRNMVRLVEKGDLTGSATARYILRNFYNERM